MSEQQRLDPKDCVFFAEDKDLHDIQDADFEITAMKIKITELENERNRKIMALRRRYSVKASDVVNIMQGFYVPEKHEDIDPEEAAEEAVAE